MQGINRIKHVYLVDALLQLENIFAEMESNLEQSVSQADSVPLKVIPTSAELKAKRLELENSHQVYLNMLDVLAFHIAYYEDLFTEVKVQYVGNRLKELKKQVQPQSVVAEKLKESIFSTYRT